MAELRFSALTLVRGGRRILGPVDGVFQSAKVTVILGPNGAGKSSLLHCIAGLEPRSSGDIHLDDRSLRIMPAGDRARRIGFLPQRAELYWNLSVRALVGLGRLAHGAHAGQTDDDRAIVESAMKSMDVATFADRPILTLSGGEQARALLARVVAGEPEWLLADEPLANLDPAHQLAVLNRMKAMAGEGVGVVAVLHDVNHAARVADHVVLMKDGSILASGAPEQVLTPQWLERTFAVPFQRIEGQRAFLTPL